MAGYKTSPYDKSPIQRMPDGTMTDDGRLFATGCDLQRCDICAPAPTHMIERRLPHLDDFTIHTGLEHAIAVQSTAKMPNLPAQLPVLLLQRKNMRDACEIDTLVLAQLLRLRKTRTSRSV